jgi:hypothetical protein
MVRKVLAVVCRVLVAAVIPGIALAQAGGALGNGISARATAIGGTTVASADGPLEAMQGNPAELTSLSGRSLDLSVTSLFASGSFTNSVSNRGTIQSSSGTLPYGAFGMRLGSRFVLGLSAAPDTMMKANWTYLDPPGTGGASYGKAICLLGDFIHVAMPAPVERGTLCAQEPSWLRLQRRIKATPRLPKLANQWA